jgi:hypothetical protein
MKRARCGPCGGHQRLQGVAPLGGFGGSVSSAVAAESGWMLWSFMHATVGGAQAECGAESALFGVLQQQNVPRINQLTAQHATGHH